MHAQTMSVAAADHIRRNLLSSLVSVYSDHSCVSYSCIDTSKLANEIIGIKVSQVTS